MGVTVGAQCKFGFLVVLVDDNGAIVVGDRVWLAHGVIVKPGVRIGSGSVDKFLCVALTFAITRHGR